MQFREIVGQTFLCNHLTECVDKGRIAHATLLCGPTASGSLALALAYIQYIYCEHRQHTDPATDPHGLRADSCGECPQCRKISKLIHSDVHLLFPNPSSTESLKGLKSAADLQEEFRSFVLKNNALGTLTEWYEFLGVANQQGSVREADADTIVRTLTLKSYEGSYKTVLIWMADYMNSTGANKLLKTLEEPSDRTLLLLVAENRATILPTILSRTQQIDVPDRINGVAWPEQFADLFVGWMRKLFKLNMQQLSQQVDELAALGREKQKHFLNYTSEMIRCCMLQSMTGQPGMLHTGDARFDASFPTMITPRNAEQIYRALNDATYAIERNAAPKITFMQLSFTLSKLIKNR